MAINLPNDDDGNALRRLEAAGSDLTKEMDIDFAVDIPDQRVGLEFASIVEAKGFRTNVSHDEELDRWTCYCSRTMLPSYESIVSIQELLKELGEKFGARPDGWGTFGNGVAHLRNPT